MKIKTSINEKNNSSEIKIDGKITIETVPDFEEIFYDLINSGSHSITINMKRVEFIDSSALGAFIRIKNVAGKAECDLKLINVHKNVSAIFKFANLESFFSIETV